MKFTEVPTDDKYQIFKHQSQRWQIGYMQDAYGFSVVAGLINGSDYEIKYYGGDNAIALNLLFKLVKEIFELLPEEISAENVKNLLPKHISLFLVSEDIAWGCLLSIKNRLRSSPIEA